MKRWLFRITAVAAATLIGLAALEITVRSVRRVDRNYGRLTDVPSITTMTIHDPLQSRDKPTGTFRIVALGDSITWGYGLRKGEPPYPDRVQGILQARYPEPCFEVVNLSRPGLNTVHQFQRLLSPAVDFTPDLVIVGYCLNDPEPSRDSEREHGLRTVYRRRPAGRVSRMLHRRSALYWFVWERLENHRQREAFRRYYHGLHDDAYIGWAACKEALKGIRNSFRARGVPVVVVIFPIFDSPLEDYAYAGVHRKVVDTCAELRIPCLDLLPWYNGFHGRELAAVPFLDSHPSALGHAVAAEAIVAFLEDRGFLPVAPGASRDGAAAR